MARLFLFVALLLVAVSGGAREPKKLADPDRFCESAKELATVTSQLPDYKISSDLAVGAKLNGTLNFSPNELLKLSRGNPVCIAVIVSESGMVQDAAVYYPKKVSLSKKERDRLLAQSYSPAQEDGAPVKSVVIMKAWNR